MRRTFNSILGLLATTSMLALGSQHAGAQRVSSSGNRLYQVVPRYYANRGLPNTKACIQNVINGVSDCNILVLGESTSTSQGSTYQESVGDMHSASWVNVLANLMRFQGINAQTNSVSGNLSLGAASGYGTADTRVTINGWFNCSLGGFCGVSFGGYNWLAGDTTAFVFNPTDPSYDLAANAPVQTDSVDIYYRTIAGSGSDTIAIDAGASTLCTLSLFNGTGSDSFTKSTCTTTLGTNTYNLKCSGSFTCLWNTIVARKSSTKQVSLINGSAGGMKVTDYVAGSGSGGAQQPWDTLQVIPVLTPKLCIILDVGNDSGAGTPIATYKAGLTSLANACSGAGADVLLISGFPGYVGIYQQGVVDTANTLNVPVWDLGSYTTADYFQNFGMNAGWNATPPGGGPYNTAHFSVGMNSWFAEKIRQIILQ